MKYLKTYESESNELIIGSKVGDTVILNTDIYSDIAGELLKKGDKFTITSIYNMWSHKDIKIEEITTINDFIQVDGIKKKIRAHFFSNELLYNINKYNL